jgi:hypothetical protein
MFNNIYVFFYLTITNGVAVGVLVSVSVGSIQQFPGIIFNSFKFQVVLSNGARTHSFTNVVLVFGLKNEKVVNVAVVETTG